MRLLTALTVAAVAPLLFSSQLPAKPNNDTTDIPAVRARDFRCEDLQEMVRTEGLVYVRGWLGGNHFRSSPNACDFRYENATAGYERTSDKRFCLVGYICTEKQDGE